MPNRRRTKAQMRAIKDAIIDFAEDQGPVTVRQTFYRLTTLGLIPKTENEYTHTVSRVMVDLRENGELRWDLVEDATRFRRAPNVYEGPKQLLEEAQRLYRRNIWSSQPVAVEVWLEKEALAGIVMDSTYDLGVGLYVNKGYGSATFIHDAAQRIDRRADALPSKHTHILYFGDWDPSGVDMSRDLADRLRKYSNRNDPLTMTLRHFINIGQAAAGFDHYFNTDPDEDNFTLQRPALTPAVIKQYNLPTKPPKQSDPRIAHFAGETVELDALPPQVLRDLARDAIEAYIDEDAMQTIRVAEASERTILANIAAAMEPDEDPDDEE